ncbi:MAG: hypothetical protein ACPL7K_06110, partial [Armatimonadota bacterium]
RLRARRTAIRLSEIYDKMRRLCSGESWMILCRFVGESRTQCRGKAEGIGRGWPRAARGG